jgi:hypothetical protein
MGEVYKLDDSIDHSIAKGNKSIHASSLDTIDELLERYYPPIMNDIKGSSCKDREKEEKGGRL